MCNRFMELETDKNGETHWIVNYKVPILGIVAVLTQVGALFWWGSGLTYNILEHDKRIVALEESTKKLHDANIEVVVKMAKLEEKLDNIGTTLYEVKQGIDYNNRMGELLTIIGNQDTNRPKTSLDKSK